MNKLVYLIVVVVALGALYYLIPSQEGTYTETQAQTLEEAIQMAKEQDKLVFVYINSQNCPYCRKMEKEFDKSDEFKKIIDEQFVWVTLDFLENPGLVRKYNLQGPPVIIVMDQNGEAITGMLGYPPNGIEEVIKMIEEGT
ncbi:MAG: thioredoxin family protein [Candidatus Methanofastidiosia archaeon]|jgi:thioredoxin-related protein